MYINVCFEGGGIKGLSYIGAIKYLEERGYRVYKASGTSVGALFASLVVAGFTSKELESIVEEIDYKLIASRNSIINGFKNTGIYSINSLEEKIKEILLRKNIKTFLDVKFGDDYLLKIITTEMRTKRMVVLPDDLPKYGYNKDSFLISKAIAMSCSIPLVFSQYRLGNYIFVDGGVTNNFPIEEVEDNKIPIFAFKLKKEYLNKIIFKNSINVINLNINNLRASQFKKGFELKEELYKIGYNDTKKYFSNMFLREK